MCKENASRLAKRPVYLNLNEKKHQPTPVSFIIFITFYFSPRLRRRSFSIIEKTREQKKGKKKSGTTLWPKTGIAFMIYFIFQVDFFL